MSLLPPQLVITILVGISRCLMIFDFMLVAPWSILSVYVGLISLDLIYHQFIPDFTNNIILSLNNILSSMYSSFTLSTHALMDTWIDPMFGYFQNPSVLNKTTKCCGKQRINWINVRHCIMLYFFIKNGWRVSLMQLLINIDIDMYLVL